MDIIQQLPFPDEICGKILLYAFKSPHTHLQEEIFKRVLSKPIYQKLVEKEGIKKNEKGHITKVSVLNDNYSVYLLNACGRVCVRFDIQIIQVFRHLTIFNLYDTRVFGDIQNLPINLTYFDLQHTDVTGDIRVLHGLPNLTKFYLRETRVWGDIKDIISMPYLTSFDLLRTGVSGDKKAFNEYRKNAGLEECAIRL